MKSFIIFLFLLLQSNIFHSQVNIEKCGLDDLPELNVSEAKYFNEVFQERRGDFDFSGKRIAFFTGSSGTVRSSKSKYFNLVNNSSVVEGHLKLAKGTQLLILTDNEREMSGGYDAILITWSKIIKDGKSRARLVKRLKNKRN